MIIKLRHIAQIHNSEDGYYCITLKLLLFIYNIFHFNHLVVVAICSDRER